jgi:hypothetical protein
MIDAFIRRFFGQKNFSGIDGSFRIHVKNNDVPHNSSDQIAYDGLLF